MIHHGIYVRIEAVFVGRHHLPRVARLLRDEVDLHDRFATFETVFPRRDQPQRRAVLIGNWFPVDPGRDEREFVVSLVDSEAFKIWPVKRGSPLTGDVLRVVEGGEGNEFRLRLWV